MADSKLSALTELAAVDVAVGDLFYVDDISVTTGKKVTAASLRVALGPQLGTEQASTAGTSIDFTGIPAGVKRITIMFDSVSTNGSSLLQVQIGDSGGFETTVYVSDSVQVTDAGASVGATATTGFITAATSSFAIRNGTMTLTLMNSATFKWVSTHTIDRTDGGGKTTISGSGIKSLSAELTQVRITTVNGTDAFDAGAINISYE